MPIGTVPEADLKYHLIAFDANGKKHGQYLSGSGQDCLMSERILETLRREHFLSFSKKVFLDLQIIPLFI